MIESISIKFMSLKPDINLCHQHAAKKGGKLISNIYINARTPLKWECEFSHTWTNTWDHINRGQWCPECSSFKTEKKVKSLLETALGFTLSKHNFTYNNNKYQFDRYNEEHKVAFEYHGYQHYIYPNFWHKTKKDFLAAQQRDIEKECYCKTRGIKLIIIPYTEDNHIEAYVSSLELFSVQ